ncbi:MAG: 5'-methylthioadenosine/S-adenosylhomocysteine nucleosidase [Bdellovibrionota bacterium]
MNKISLLRDQTLFLMALPLESQGLFEAQNIPVYYTGIGKVNAAFQATKFILESGCSQVLNLGTAGSHVFPTHSMIECSGFVQRDMDLTPLGFPLGETPMEEDPAWKGLIPGTKLYPHLKKGICGTGDRFEVGPPAVDCQLVDMEAYAMAKVCKKLKVNFISIKYITDGSDHQAHNDWSANLKLSAQALFEFSNKYWL